MDIYFNRTILHKSFSSGPARHIKLYRALFGNWKLTFTFLPDELVLIRSAFVYEIRVSSAELCFTVLPPKFMKWISCVRTLVTISIEHLSILVILTFNQLRNSNVANNLRQHYDFVDLEFGSLLQIYSNHLRNFKFMDWSPYF